MLRVINIEKKVDDIYEKRYIKDMKKLDDGNILLLEDDLLKIINIEDNKIVELSVLKGEGDKIFILSEGNFMTKYENNSKTIYLYHYSNKKLYYDKEFDLDNIIKKWGGLQDICPINKNRVAITCFEEGKIYGWNNYLLIYDFIEEQKKKLMKVGEGKNKLCLINDNNLILYNRNKIILIDIEEFKIIGEIKDIPSIENILLLNEKSFITYDIDFTQYEIDLKDKKKIIKKGSAGITSNYILNSIQKYPGNKLVIGNLDTIAIVGE